MVLARRPSAFLVMLALAALASVLARFVPLGADAPAWIDALGAAWPVLVAALGAASAATIALRIFRSGLSRKGRGRVARAIRPVEGAVAALALLVALAAITGNAGDALVSLGLVGFGVTLALQRPLLALAGWVAIHAGRLFREGDRIETMGISGDVIEIGLLSTKLWEIGMGPGLSSAGASTPQRPTGRIVTLSNATFLEHPLANATGDVTHVFDEFVVTVAYEADVALARRLLAECAAAVLDPADHQRAAEAYARLSEGMAIEAAFPREPTVIESLAESWIELRLRYLVPARERGATRTRLARAWLDLSRPHAAALPNVYPRVQPQNVGPDGRPRA